MDYVHVKYKAAKGTQGNQFLIVINSTDKDNSKYNKNTIGKGKSRGQQAAT